MTLKYTYQTFILSPYRQLYLQYFQLSIYSLWGVSIKYQRGYLVADWPQTQALY